MSYQTESDLTCRNPFLGVHRDNLGIGDVENPVVHDEDSYGSKSFVARHMGLIILALSALCAGFGNSLEPVSILTVLHVFLLLIGIEEAIADQDLQTWKSFCIFVYLIITQALGFCLGFAGIMAYPSTSLFSVSAAIGLGILVWVIYSILAIIPYVLYIRKYPSTITSIFIFPVLHTVAVCTLIGYTFSTFVALGNAFLDYGPLRQVATLLGIYGVNFITVFLGSFPAYVLSRYNHMTPSVREALKRYSLMFLIGFFIVTGFLIQQHYLYQVQIPQLTPTKLPVSCIFSQGAKVGTSDYNQLWNSTLTRIQKGDGIVLMAEEAMYLNSTSQENEVINFAIKVAKESTLADGVLLGITYELEEPGKEMKKNKFVLVSSHENSPLWSYQKAHPVPIVEAEIEPGEPTLPYVHTNYGKVAGAICFDLDFPQYIADAGRVRADIFLQPSWTWNAINFRHFEGDALRAVENGFTLFRCSSDGESGIVDPYGKFLAREYTGHDPRIVSTFQLPLNKHVITFFPFLGFIFEYFLIVFSVFYYISIVMDMKEALGRYSS
jgi:apolipoprotein N-acyltransferase